MFGTKSGERPFLEPYIPEIGVTKVFKNDLQYRYLLLMGVLRWAIELGRIYIVTKIGILSQQECNPKEGELNSLYGMF